MIKLYIIKKVVTELRRGIVMKKKWVTVFPRCENFHITKEVGAIPGVISEKFENEYECFLVSWKNGYYPDENHFFPRLKHTFIKKRFFTSKNRYLEVLSELLSVSLFILKEGKSIDVINFFHLRWYTSLLVIYFKRKNPNGKVYVKLDAAQSIFNIKRSSKILPLVPLKYEKVLDKINVVSVETKLLSEQLSQLWDREVLYIPNGYYPYKFDEIKFSEKKKKIIHVARMGTYQKNTEFFIEAVVKNQNFLSQGGWKIVLVGSMTKTFKETLDNLFNTYPLLLKIIEIHGVVGDKKKLLTLYSESRIFVLTSRSESFGISLVEALATGNQVLTSNIVSAPDIVPSKKNGFIYKNEDITDFSEKLIQLINNKNWKKDSEYVQNFARTNFYYPKIIERLVRKINER